MTRHQLGHQAIQQSAARLDLDWFHTGGFSWKRMPELLSMDQIAEFSSLDKTGRNAPTT